MKGKVVKPPQKSKILSDLQGQSKAKSMADAKPSLIGFDTFEINNLVSSNCHEADLVIFCFFGLDSQFFPSKSSCFSCSSPSSSSCDRGKTKSTPSLKT